jgi:hypothetical protein
VGGVGSGTARSLSGSIGQDEPGQLRVAAVKETDVADSLDECARRALGQQVECRVAIVPFTHPGTNLDQFVVGEGAVHLSDDRVGEAVVAKGDDRIQGMPEAAQVFLLSFRELHGREHSAVAHPRGWFRRCPNAVNPVDVRLQEHESDAYVQRARKEGMRSRAAFKLKAG